MCRNQGFLIFARSKQNKKKFEDNFVDISKWETCRRSSISKWETCWRSSMFSDFRTKKPGFSEITELLSIFL